MNDKSAHFFKLVRDFLMVYLPDQKAVSPNTVKSYRESLNLLLNYICDTAGISLGKVSFKNMERETIEAFLEYLEKDRCCSVSTRNHRLACIRSFVKYAGARDVGVQAFANNLCCIPRKKGEKSAEISFFSESALKTILEQPDVRKKKDLRNLFLQKHLQNVIANSMTIKYNNSDLGVPRYGAILLDELTKQSFDI